MRARAWWLVATLACAGCGLVLGLEDKFPYPDDAGIGDGGSVDGATMDGAPLGDAAPDGNASPCAKCGPYKCTNGQCELVTLATTSTGSVDGGAENPLAVAVSGTRVFWSTNRGTIYACDRDQCSTTTKRIAVPFATDGYAFEDKVYMLAADANYVYWGQYYNERIFRTGHDGGTVDAFDAHGYPSTLALDADNLYWTNFGAGTSSLWRCRKAECFVAANAPILMSDPYVAQTKPIVNVCTEPQNRCWYAVSLALTDDWAVFIDAKPDRYGDVFSIAKTAVDAGVRAWSNFEHPFPNPNAVTTYANIIYFAASGGAVADASDVPGNITALQDGFNPEVKVEDPAPTSIATDGTDLFWVSYDTGTIRRCAIAGCANKPTDLATNQPGAASLVATGGTIYWVNAKSSEVQMLIVR